MSRTFRITESQYRAALKEGCFRDLSLIDEGLFYTRPKNGQRTVSFRQGANNKIDDTIFNDDKSLKMNQMVLPKSGVIAYNLYDIKSMRVNKTLKHGVDEHGRTVTRTPSMENFINRSIMLIRRVLGNSPVDIITYPQSSSEFNREITEKLLATYPHSEGIRLKPELLVKNVRGMYVNADAAKKLGLTDQEIFTLSRRVEKWKKDEDVRDQRRKIAQLEQEVAGILAQKKDKRGRPSRELVDKRQQIAHGYDQISDLRKGMKGKDSTVDDKGNVKGWQIKSLDDKQRRAIEGLFTINPAYQSQYKSLHDQFAGKNIVVFDDNISSGATMDDVCLALQQLGVASIKAFTLGTIEPTIYNTKERWQWNAEHKK
ncbi:MAG: hypothetical protein LUD72_12180 [Bacteroidales bacterium]|nr:hypothetical protein [Bacteroidales bacterium]